MATDLSSSSKSKLSSSAKKDNKLKGPKSKNLEENEPIKAVVKRKTNPGIRVVGSRIYDSENGKTCHQCRQKTTDFVVVCRNQINNKACTIAYCHKCLLNRYGENAEEVSTLGDWNCPKCKGICNCSFCMKKQGHHPTGILAHTAKANGYSSVSEMLQNSGPTISNHEKLVTEMDAPKMDNMIISPTKLGKENSFTGKIDTNFLPDSPLDSVMEKDKESKLKGSGKRQYASADANTSVKRRMLEGKGKKNIEDISHERVVVPDDKKPKNPEQDKVNGIKDGTLLRRTSPRKNTPSNETLKINGILGAKSKSNALSEGKIIESQESNPIDHSRQNFDDKKDSGNLSLENPIANDKKLKNPKQHKLKDMPDGTLLRRTSPRKHAPSKETSKINGKVGAKSNALSEMKILEGQDSKHIDQPNQNPDEEKVQNLKKLSLVKKTSPRKLKKLNETVKENPVFNACHHVKEKVKVNSLVHNKMNIKKLDDHDTQSKANGESTEINAMYQRVPCDKVNDDIKFPQGVELTSIDGSDLSAEDIGKALQFLEFCAAFGKILDVKKGQPESVLKDLLHGRTSRRGKYSATVQFHVHLLSIIQEEREGSVDIDSSEGKQLWVQALKECISESEGVLRSLELDHLCKGADAYENLKSTEKLQILNVLCDEVLGTAKIRNWIDDQVMKQSEKAKEQKEKVADAKNKEKSLKHKVQNEIAKAIIEKKGSCLSVSEHEAIVSQIKIESALAHSELLESEGLLAKSNQTPDAVRIEPEYISTDGHVYWKLKSLSNKSDIAMQDIGSDNITCHEKWYSFDEEQKKAIQKSINVLRFNKLRAQKIRKSVRRSNNGLALNPLDVVSH